MAKRRNSGSASFLKVVPNAATSALGCRPLTACGNKLINTKSKETDVCGPSPCSSEDGVRKTHRPEASFIPGLLFPVFEAKSQANPRVSRAPQHRQGAALPRSHIGRTTASHFLGMWGSGNQERRVALDTGWLSYPLLVKISAPPPHQY